MQHEKALQDAIQDPLTGLPGHVPFVDQCEQTLQDARADGLPVSVGLLDIDLFGRINRDHGEPIGDAVLRLLAEKLSSVFDGGQVFRYGGDAFAVVLPGVEKEQAFLQLEALRSAVSGTHTVAPDGDGEVVADAQQPVELSLAVSAGIAAFPDDAADVVDLLRKTNEALYRAKVSGSNKVCLAREEKMVTKTSHYAQGQLHGLARLAKREGISEAVLLREALDDLLRKYNA